MGFEKLANDLEKGQVDVRKSIEDGMSGILKQDKEGILKDKSVRVESAENGVVVNVHTEVEFGKGEKRDWRYFTKRFVFDDMKSALPTIESEMDFKMGDKVKMSDLEPKKGKAKFKVAKRAVIAFMVGSGETGIGGHVHIAKGQIEDREADGKSFKVFVGDTEPDKTLWPFGTRTNDPENGFTKGISETMKAHAHKFEIPLNREDESGHRVMGQTTEVEGHSHPVDVVDFYSVETSNAPDA